jgi:lipopolysaccharide biosynthesis glycosyltransferase
LVPLKLATAAAGPRTGAPLMLLDFSGMHGDDDKKKPDGFTHTTWAFRRISKKFGRYVEVGVARLPACPNCGAHPTATAKVFLDRRFQRRAIAGTNRHSLHSASTKAAVCYVADRNFMLPTLISATQIRRFVPAHEAKIYIFVISEDDAELDQIRQFVKPFDLEIIHIDSSVFVGIEWARAHKSYIPLAALGRFFIAELLPQSCRNVLYIDGDTWINKNPAPLIQATLPEGKIAVAEDICAFCARDLTSFGRTIRSYFRALGITPAQGYFNSGVFAVTRNTWRTIATEAFKVFKKNTETCRFIDQSAMNAVVGDRRIRLSLAWNFQTAYRYWGIEKAVNPIIYHFTEGNKPWTGPVEPWAEMFPLYQKEAAAFAPLALPSRRLSAREVRTINASACRQRLKLRAVYPWRLWSRRKIARRLSKESQL